MMKRPLIALGAVLATISLVFAACGDDDDDNGSTAPTAATTSAAGETPGTSTRLKVVTTVAPITSLAENIIGNAADIEGIVPEGVSSHEYEPPPSVAALLAEADVIFVNGLALEEPTFQLAEANKKPTTEVVRLGDGTISEDDWQFDFSFPESEGNPNPHLWPNVQHSQKYAQLIHAKMVELDPANKETYDANFAELDRRLDLLHEAMLTATATVPEANRKLITYHDSWAYWAPVYGFTVIGAVQPSDFSEPSPQEIARIIDQIREENIPAIFGSEVYPSSVLQTIADETGAEYVDDLRDDDLPGKPGDDRHTYIGLMVQNMEIMLVSLGGNADAMADVPTDRVFAGESSAVYPQ
jgi:ABC-type Zn uptake system ZnuABC Zn-binding protein ZnuA